MHLTLSLAPLVSLLTGILILIVLRLLSYFVAVYPIVIGILGLVGDIAGPEHLGDVSPSPQQQAATLAGRRFSRVPDH
jgi:hypothetical protein